MKTEAARAAAPVAAQRVPAVIRLAMAKGLLFALAVMAGCGNMTQAPADIGGDMVLDMTAPPDMVTAGTAPAGFGTACTSSPECASFKVDGGPGFLGCASYLGADYCTLPCGQSAGGALCWSGTTCTCVARTNVSGLPETDCYCAKM